MRILSIPESEHCSYEAIEIGQERGVLAWCATSNELKPLLLAPCAQGRFDSAHRNLGGFFRALAPEGFHMRWFPDRCEPTLLGPYAPHAAPGALVEVDVGGAMATPSTWAQCEHWLRAREARALRAELASSTALDAPSEPPSRL